MFVNEDCNIEESWFPIFFKLVHFHIDKQFKAKSTNFSHRSLLILLTFQRCCFLKIFCIQPLCCFKPIVMTPGNFFVAVPVSPITFSAHLQQLSSKYWSQFLPGKPTIAKVFCQ